MNIIKSNLCLLALMAISFTVAAQTNPYPEEKENGDYARTVTFGGQKPGLGDFINTIVDEAEDEHTGSIAEMWEKHQKNKPLDNGDKVTFDPKNGYACFEQNPGDGFIGETEFCYWNCSNPKYKLVANSFYLMQNGKAVETEFTGLGFYIYNTQTKKLTYSSLYDMGIEINTEGEVSGIAYILPRVGKDIKAVIYSNKGKKEVILKWNGLRFDIQQ